MGKMSEDLGNVLQGAVNLADKMSQDILTLEHVFYSLISIPNGDALVRATGVDTSILSSSIISYLEKYIPPSTESRDYDNPQHTPAFSRVFENMVAHAESSSKQVIGIGDLFVSCMRESDSYCVRLLKSLGVSIEDVIRIVVDFEDRHKVDRAEEQVSYIEKYAKNLNKLATDGKIDPLIGRETEVNQICQVLCRRKKNNPILIGEAGVGKSAIVEGLALRITEGNVPKKLLDSVIYSVDVSSVIAGTKYRGEFETRIKKILSEVEKDKNTIIFFDEIHMIVGAGQSHSGGMDFSNLLKPMLANGKLRCIGATTTSDYKTSIDKDKALARRFTQIKVDEPTQEECLKILQKIAPLYERFHNVTYTSEALEACVSLSSKYISEKHLPDKAIDLLDEAGAKSQLNEYVERKKIEVRNQDLAPLLFKNLENLDSLKIYGTRDSKIKTKATKTINKQYIETLMAEVINIPKSSIDSDESNLLKHLESNLKKRIFSQDSAIEKIAEKIMINKAGLGDLNKPIASFLFTGPSGVGKTELSKELAKLLGIKFERIDMSEYAESHSISKLIGSPAGYVGYESGGLLINKIRTNPHCVLLLDEIEKAHSDIYNVLLQIMDSATLTDNQNNKADFKNVILIMTSNAGSKEGNSVGFFDTSTNRADLAIKHTFSPEFRSRLDAVINFDKLGEKDLQRIAQKYIDDLNETLQEKHITLKLSTKAAKFLAKSSMDTALGAREIKKIIDTRIKLPLSNEILFGKLKKGGNARIELKDDSISLIIDKD